MPPLNRSRISAGARALAERLREEARLAPSDSTFDVADRLARWVRNVSGGAAGVFEERLELVGLTPAQAESALRRSPSDGADAAWLDALLYAQACRGGSRNEVLDAAHRVPFEEILLPFVTAAERSLRARIDLHAELIAESALRQFLRRLLIDLSWIAARTLQLKFSLFRSRRAGPLAALDLLDASSDTLYRQFIEDLRDGGLERLWNEYPVLARLIASTIAQWVDATAELLDRIHNDRGVIAEMFGAPGALVRVLPGHSDRHNGGRSAFCLQFASGLRLVYKPKSLGIDVAWFSLIDWLNARGAELSLATLRVLPRGDYGWMEMIEAQPCASAEEAARYYWRCGALLCLAYALQAIDLHQENLIARGEHPVPIDLETMLHPSRRNTYGSTASLAVAISSRVIEQSVLRTGMLPTWDVGPGGRVFDSSSLGGVGDQRALFRGPVWSGIGTDAMQLRYEETEAEKNANVPKLGDTPLEPQQHVKDVVRGFESMYRLLLAERDALLAAGGPIDAFAGQRIRFVFRATSMYAAMREKLLHPRYFRDGADRGIEMDVLYRSLLTGSVHPVYVPLVASEQRALESLDIPLFFTTTTSTDVRAHEGLCVEDAFEITAFEQGRAQLATLDEADLQHQLDMIKASFGLREAGHTITIAGASKTNIAEELSDDELVDHALALAREIDQHAIRGKDGSASWIGPVYVESAQRFQVHTLSLDLYDGLCGVGLFLSALAAVTRDARMLDLARGTFASVRTALRADARVGMLVRVMGIGAMTGIGSLIYALTRASEWLDDASYLDDAHAAAAMITSDSIAEDVSYDVISGAAGAMLSLRALHALRPSRDLEERMRACGEHLLAHRVMTPSGFRTWRHTAMARELTGFAHGSAGIAYALLLLVHDTGDERFRDAAIEAQSFEDALYSPEHANWADTRGAAIYGDDRLRYITTWCYGAPGIGLGRVAALPMNDSAATRAAVDTALQTTRAFGVRGEDHLCCGTMGRLELFLTASRILGDSSLETLARQFASTSGRAATQRRHFVMPQVTYSPGLFVGTAGIGYQLLRLAAPDRIPPVLLLGTPTSSAHSR